MKHNGGALTLLKQVTFRKCSSALSHKVFSTSFPTHIVRLAQLSGNKNDRSRKTTVMAIKNQRLPLSPADFRFQLQILDTAAFKEPMCVRAVLILSDFFCTGRHNLCLKPFLTSVFQNREGLGI